MLFPRYAAIELGYTNYQELSDVDRKPEALSHAGDSLAYKVSLHHRSSQKLAGSADTPA